MNEYHYDCIKNYSHVYGNIVSCSLSHVRQDLMREFDSICDVTLIKRL